ncbi:LysM peptidoglycan-binding domain-containing protein [Ferroacidibacillus organovorans]|uniref:LysM domain-containing protein n=1 Tax=Ferroacidibacillus organovorans TaxID=1765683 RepID=A0A101XR16_9BACL|nr:LysM peptidoglycan-binding domain-containing protein [Ferroacidibacillus organovorans]KUO95953.1 hypothetical protein ATW55_02410 [Ferroacidibacillus organovorans]
MNKKLWAFSTLATIALGASSLAPAFAATVTVQSGQSLWSISQQQHVPLAGLEQANPSVNPANLLIGTVLQLPQGAPSSSYNTYTVQPGDTFWTIANAHHVSLSALIAANPNVQANNLLIGSTLALPAGAHVAAQQTTPATASSATTTASSATSGAQSGYTASDLYWMERVIHAEAQGEPLAAQIAVGDVVLHRMEQPNGPTTVQGVVFQVINGHYQFTCVPQGTIYQAPDATSVTAALDVLQNHQDLVPGALVFYNPAQTPASSWVRQQPYLASIGNFVFAK